MIEKIKLKNIRLWSMNPRLDQELRSSGSFDTVDEQMIMDELWESVGKKKMLELANYINEKGLYEDEIIIVVKNGKYYDVYDGNRRVAALKYIASDKFKSDNKTFTKESEISVSIMEEDDAIERIFIKHAGESALRTIGWNAYMSDRSLYNAGKSPRYAKAFELVKNGSLNKDKLKHIEYTEIDGALRNKTLMSIVKENFNNANLYDVLSYIKTELKFKTYSRFLTGIENNDEKKTNIRNVLNQLISPFDEPTLNESDGKETDTKNSNQSEDENQNYFFVLKKTKYKAIFGSAYNIRKNLEFEVEPVYLDKIVIKPNDNQVVLEDDCTQVQLAPGNYVFIIQNGKCARQISLDVYLPQTKKQKTVVPTKFYTDYYFKHFEISHAVAFVFKFLAETEITPHNIYVLTILLRQYLEFLYKLYAEKVDGSSLELLKKSLSSGINNVNGTLWNSDNSICTISQKRSISNQVITLISRVQESSHNIESIQETELKDLFTLLVPFIQVMIAKMSGQ